MKCTSLTLVATFLVGAVFAQTAYQLPYQPIPSTTPAYTPVPSAASTLPPAIVSAENSRTVQLQGSANMGTVVPLTLPGYELRVMDVTKSITFDVNGQPVTAEIPIFIYLPRSTQSVGEATKELRKIYNDLIMLYDQERVDKERVRSMLKRMDSIIDSFDALTPTVGRHTTTAY